MCGHLSERIVAETPFRKASVEAFAPEAYRTAVLHIETAGDGALPLSLELERWGSPEKEYYRWQTGCGCGWMLDWNRAEETLQVLEKTGVPA